MSDFDPNDPKDCKEWLRDNDAWIRMPGKPLDTHALALAQARRIAEPCRWTEDEDGVWNTDCGRSWEFTSGGPTQNRVKFCIECGHHVVEEVKETEHGTRQPTQPR